MNRRSNKIAATARAAAQRLKRAREPRAGQTQLTIYKGN